MPTTLRIKIAMPSRMLFAAISCTLLLSSTLSAALAEPVPSDQVDPFDLDHYAYEDLLAALEAANPANPSEIEPIAAESAVRPVHAAVPSSFVPVPPLTNRKKLVPEPGWLPVPGGTPRSNVQVADLSPDQSIRTQTIATSNIPEKAQSGEKNEQLRLSSPPITVFPNDTIVIHYEILGQTGVRTERNIAESAIPGAGTLEQRIQALIDSNCLGFNPTQMIIDLLKSPLRVRAELLSRLEGKKKSTELPSNKSPVVNSPPRQDQPRKSAPPPPPPPPPRASPPRNSPSPPRGSPPRSNSPRSQSDQAAKKVVTSQFTNFPGFQRIVEDREQVRSPQTTGQRAHASQGQKQSQAPTGTRNSRPRQQQNRQQQTRQQQNRQQQNRQQQNRQQQTRQQQNRQQQNRQQQNSKNQGTFSNNFGTKNNQEVLTKVPVRKVIQSQQQQPLQPVTTTQRTPRVIKAQPGQQELNARAAAAQNNNRVPSTNPPVILQTFNPPPAPSAPAQDEQAARRQPGKAFTIEKFLQRYPEVLRVSSRFGENKVGTVGGRNNNNNEDTTDSPPVKRPSGNPRRNQRKKNNRNNNGRNNNNRNTGSRQKQQVVRTTTRATTTTTTSTTTARITTTRPPPPPTTLAPRRQPKLVPQQQNPNSQSQGIQNLSTDVDYPGYDDNGELSSDEYSYLYYEDYYEELVPEHHRFNQLTTSTTQRPPRRQQKKNKKNKNNNNNNNNNGATFAFFQNQPQDKGFPNFPTNANGGATPKPNNKPAKVIQPATVQNRHPLPGTVPPPPPPQPAAVIPAGPFDNGIQVGPYGYTDKGTFFSDAATSGFPNRIEIIYQGFIWAMKVSYPESGVQKHGGVHTILKDKVKREVIRLKPGDYVVRITGRASPYNINRFTLYTNTGKKYGPYGDRRSEESVDFDESAPEGHALAFFSGTVDFGVPLRSISMHWKPTSA